MILAQLVAYVQLDDVDRARLIALHVELAPFFPSIAARFYEAVWANPGAAAVLAGPAQVERLRVSLIDWMSTGLLGPYDDKFDEKRSRIGHRHVQIGLAQHYMFTSLNVVRLAYLDRITTLYPADEALLVVRSVDKLFDLELALMLRHYQLDSENRLVARERQIQADRILALQTLTAGIAHEIRNPLNAAKLQLELLERRIRRLGEDPKLTEPIGLAHHEIQRLATMLNDFLAFARPAELHPAEHDIIVIARHVLELERPLAALQGTSIELLPPFDAALSAVDPDKCHQIIQNLVRNASEAAVGGQVRVAITVDAGTLHIRVADTGGGMKAEVRPRIYEPFFTTKEAGVGMGMSIVHNFVTMHDGTIDIATGATGTLVDVAIPRRRPPA